jgi:hypothetical protein
MSNRYAAYQKRWRRQNPLYKIWQRMNQRCTNPKSNRYYLYGERGIQVKYANYWEFLRDVGPRPSPKHSIDRINNDGHYEIGNCRWATPSEQNYNRRPYIRKGSLQSQCAMKGLSYKAVWRRINNLGWSKNQALTTAIGG